MTYKYNNVYVKEVSTIVGKYEKNGPLGKYFDYAYCKDLYFGMKSFEKAEIKLSIDGINNILNKCNYKDSDVDLLISGDLQNQLASSDYMARCFKIPFLGVYNACASSAEGIIIGSTFIDSGKINNCICNVTSHNTVAEKQFRNPVEYGAPKSKTSTFTTTGSACVILSNEANKVKIESATVGVVNDANCKDVNHMGAVMAISAGDTIYRHLTDLKRDAMYYDIILTGDLGVYGKKILIDYMKKEYNIDISKNYDDCGSMIYNIDIQPVLAGGSGPACSALVMYGYIYKKMLGGVYKRVLFVPTGAIFSPTMVFQRESIPSIAHAVSWEVV